MSVWFLYFKKGYRPPPFSEKFYLVVIEKDSSGCSILHMWHLHLRSVQACVGESSKYLLSVESCKGPWLQSSFGTLMSLFLQQFGCKMGVKTEVWFSVWENSSLANRNHSSGIAFLFCNSPQMLWVGSNQLLISLKYPLSVLFSLAEIKIGKRHEVEFILKKPSNLKAQFRTACHLIKCVPK